MKLQSKNCKSLFLLFSLLVSCFSYSISLLDAYKLAGKNKSELKAVIKHYSKHPADSLKKKSAIFLIENMDGHFSYSSSEWTKYNNDLDSLYKLKLPRNEVIKGFNILAYDFENQVTDFVEQPDLKFIKADYLIRNIDSAFLAWQKPNARSLNFNQFCEYLLPYRLGNEELTDWREYYAHEFKLNFLKKTKFNTDSVHPYSICILLNRYFATNIQYKNSFTPDYNAKILFNNKTGTCQEWAYLSVFVGRSLGIPVSADFTPHWANRSMGHNWNSLNIDNKSSNFCMSDWSKIGDHFLSYTNRKIYAPKIFRTTYKNQPQSLACIHGTEIIPNEFSSPFIQDVSEEYFKTIDISIELKNNVICKYAYICVFDNQEWVPVYWSEIFKNNAVFKKMNTGIVYLPTYYINESYISANYPIKLNTDSSIIILKPNFLLKQNVILKRKYNDSSNQKWSDAMKGGVFQAANDSLFEKPTDLYKIDSSPEICFRFVNIKSDSSYRYFRYLSPPNSFGMISEIELFGLNNNKITGKVIGTKDSKFNNGIANVFDGNVLKGYIGNKRDNNWVGLEFDTPQAINKIVYLPRNDDNFIRDGELYELFYWDNKWVSLGQQTGSIKTQSLTYTNVPTNALFLLRDLTKGQEERIFTYENGKQVWW